MTIQGIVIDYPIDGTWSSMGCWVPVLRMVGDCSEDGGLLSWGWWVPILVMIGDPPWDVG